MTKTVVALLALAAFVPAAAGAGDLEPCTSTPRPPANPLATFQEQAFGFHDEELVICSPGAENPAHIAARLWVPRDCPGVGGCAGVVIAHGFGFSKELTFADMYALVGRGLYVLSYDVRGQGASGGQAELLGRDDVADQAAVLAWWHGNVEPTKTAFYGISQGGWLSMTAAVYNCGADRAASFDSTIPCDQGGRWIDAIVPMQGPTETIDDGTCTIFAAEAIAESRGNVGLAQSMTSCPVDGRPGEIPGAFVNVSERIDRIDVPVYAVTSFYDRLVPARQVTAAYEQLHARALDSQDVMYGKDVRLTLSNDAHRDVGGNLAVTDDVFAWIQQVIDGGPALRDVKVAIGQEWGGNTFRLEEAWPIPGATPQTLHLGRGSAGELAAGPSGDTPDELRNLPVLEPNDASEVPDLRLVYTTAPYLETVEITGEPSATIYVSSANAESNGTGQLNLRLFELTPDGSTHEFSHARLGLIGLGPDPVAVSLPLSIAGHRIDAGNRLMLAITPSDVAVALPAPGLDPWYVHHDASAPSSITIPVVPVDRTPPSGEPPTGAAYTEDPTGAICGALNLPC